MKPAVRKILDKQLAALLRDFEKLMKPRTVRVQLKHFPVNAVIDLIWEDGIECNVYLAGHSFRSLKNDPMVKSGLFSVRNAQDFYSGAVIDDYDFVYTLISKNATGKAAYNKYNSEIKAFCKKAEQFGKLYFDDDGWFFDEYSVSDYRNFDLKANLKGAKRKVDGQLEYINDGC